MPAQVRDVIPFPTPTTLYEETINAAIEAAGRNAALAIARLNRSLGNPMGRGAEDSYIINSQRRTGDAEKRFHRTLEQLHAAAGLEASLPAIRTYHEASARILRRRFRDLERVAARRHAGIGYDQAPGLAFDGGLAQCHEDEGRTAPADGSPPSGPPRTSTPGFASVAASPSAPATSRSTANAIA